MSSHRLCNNGEESAFPLEEVNANDRSTQQQADRSRSTLNESGDIRSDETYDSEVDVSTDETENKEHGDEQENTPKLVIFSPFH